MLSQLMAFVAQAERAHKEPHLSSFAPYEVPGRKYGSGIGGIDSDDDRFLPCHYFGELQVFNFKSRRSKLTKVYQII